MAHALVLPQIVLQGEPPTAELALKRPNVRVQQSMTSKVLGPRKPLAANLTGKRSPAVNSVQLLMPSQMRGQHKRLAAYVTHVRPLAGVHLAMPSQVTRSGKLRTAVLNITLKRSLACVNA